MCRTKTPMIVLTRATEKQCRMTLNFEEVDGRSLNMRAAVHSVTDHEAVDM